MHILGDKWQGGYLDYHLKPDEIRIKVCAWMVVSKISGMFFERPKSIQMVFNYIREIGIVSTLNKIRSRRAEKLRNKRFFSIGLGRILESDFSEMATGSPVVFIATAHPRCVERITVPVILAKRIEGDLIKPFEGAGGIYWYAKEQPDLDDKNLSGWSPESGFNLDHQTLEKALQHSINAWCDTSADRMSLLQFAALSPVQTKSSEQAISSKKIRACLFGLGNYAKTQIIGNIPKEIDLVRIHELDPTQIGQIDKVCWPVDTNPGFNDEEDCDVCFIAGYHHTHADLAKHTIESGSYAVVEKPLVTTHDQFDRLTKAIINHPGRLFTCFHMRYNPLLKNIWNDLNVQPGQAIHYYCTVFEVPLPPLHWYNWPSSRSHITSNACHWLDHFLYLNRYSEPESFHVITCMNGDSQIHVQLANGAVLGMHLTHAGSARLGVRDHVEMRTDGRTAILESGSKYSVESSEKIIKRKSGNRIDAYRTMYRVICRKILKEEPGDSTDSILTTNALILDLEREYQRQVSNRNMRNAQ